MNRYKGKGEHSVNQLESLIEEREEKLHQLNTVQKEYTTNEILTITSNMYRFGGGFMKALSDAISRADQENLKKLQSVFPEEFERYLNI